MFNTISHVTILVYIEAFHFYFQSYILKFLEWKSIKGGLHWVTLILPSLYNSFTSRWRSIWTLAFLNSHKILSEAKVYVGNMVLTCVFPMTNHLSMFSCANWLPVDLLLEKGLFLTTCPFFTWVICLSIIEL